MINPFAVFHSIYIYYLKVSEKEDHLSEYLNKGGFENYLNERNVYEKCLCLRDKFRDFHVFLPNLRN